METIVKQRIIFSWSGGKDSALGLAAVLAGGDYEVAALLTSSNADYGRVSMHGVRRSLLRAQAASLGLPLREILLPAQCDNAIYEQAMAAEMEEVKALGIDTVAFADLFLEDLRRYREDNLARVGMKALFPVWGNDTPKLAREFIGRGFQAILVSVDGDQLDGSFVGRLYDHDLLADLPEGVDPCGENGEFHSFVFDGPIFKEPIKFETGEKAFRDHRFHYIDLVPVN
jgi:uncharacterized protein (TIGR00290 family)